MKIIQYLLKPSMLDRRRVYYKRKNKLLLLHENKKLFFKKNGDHKINLSIK